MPTKFEDRRKRAVEVDDRFDAAYPDADCALDFTNAFELLVATILSAQTTDERVNRTTPELFRRWPTPQALAAADPEAVEEVVRPLGMQRQRTKSLVGMATGLMGEDGDQRGEVPADSAALQRLPGVGRKTAHVIMGNAFGIPAITVDTHVGRLARRLGWSAATGPLRVEKDIAALIPQERWTMMSHRLIEHGRAICTSRRPECGRCVVADLCPSAFQVEGSR